MCVCVCNVCVCVCVCECVFVCARARACVCVPARAPVCAVLCAVAVRCLDWARPLSATLAARDAVNSESRPFAWTSAEAAALPEVRPSGNRHVAVDPQSV
jgi:hypothetical protein